MFSNRMGLALFCIMSCSSISLHARLLPAVIIASVADLRSDKIVVPAGIKAPAFSKDMNGQLAQLCFGESVLIDTQECDNTWVKVTTIEQKIITQQGWMGCPGYVQKKDVMLVDQLPHYTVALRQLWTPLYAEKDGSVPLNMCPFGTLLQAHKADEGWWQVELGGKVFGYIQNAPFLYQIAPIIKETEFEMRNSFVQLARMFLQTHYGWGCRTPGWADKNTVSPCVAGTDCSSLVNILFRTIGLEVPKNSTSQYVAAPIKIEHGGDAKPGDLLFFARSEDPSKMCHVMIYMGKDQEGKGYVLESTGRGVSSMAEAYEKGLKENDLGVRIVALKDYIGVDIDDIHSGITKYELRGYSIYIATYFQESACMQYLRTMLLERR